MLKCLRKLLGLKVISLGVVIILSSDFSIRLKILSICSLLSGRVNMLSMSLSHISGAALVGVLFISGVVSFSFSGNMSVLIPCVSISSFISFDMFLYAMVAAPSL